jgi:hypothetical protein
MQALIVAIHQNDVNAAIRIKAELEGGDILFNQQLVNDLLQSKIGDIYPAHYAAQRGLLEMTLALIPKTMVAVATGGMAGLMVMPLMVRDADGRTPWHYFAEQGMVESVRNQVRGYNAGPYSGCLEAQDNNGHTMLHIAARRGHLALICELLKVQAKRSIKDQQGRTALHLACEAGNVDCVRAIIEHKTWAERLHNLRHKPADYLINLTDSQGRTAMDYAVLNQRHSVVLYLRTLGAKLTEHYKCRQVLNAVASNPEISLEDRAAASMARRDCSWQLRGPMLVLRAALRKEEDQANTAAP